MSYSNENNRLAYITDAATNAADTDDLKNQTSNNYQYDEIGNLTQDLEGKNDKIFWTAYGKVSKVIKDNNDSILYRYDATGQRISKTFKDKTTFYVRDASGNVMATYEAPQPPAGGVGATVVAAKELMIYGSARVGVYNGKSERMKATLGNKNYELSNHLGNVLVTITDNKFIATVGVFVAKVNSTTDYYPFGMAIKERTWQSKEYRYGFNGKENDTESGSVDFEARSYYEKTGRFISVDAQFKVFPHRSSHAYALNNPIILTDDDGNLPILPLLIYVGKNFGEGAATDLVVQMVGAYLFGDAQNLNEAWAAVNLEQVAWAGAENLIQNKHAEAIKEGSLAVIEYMRNTDNPTAVGATKAFLLAGGSSYLGDWISKKGAEQVAKGLKKLGLSEAAINRHLQIEGTTRVGSSEEISAARNKIAKQRGKSNTPGNYGYLEGEVDGVGKLDDKMWGSVSKSTANTDAGKYNIFTPTHVGESNRFANTDSEYRMLTDLALRIRKQYGENYANATGTIKIVSEREYCASCQGVIQQFQAMFPKINIVLIQVGGNEKVPAKHK